MPTGTTRAKAEYLETGRALVRAAHPEETPLVVDPFAGRRLHPLGGPAVRLRSLRQRPQPRRLPHPQGDAGGHPPAWAGLADELRKVGAEIKAKAEKELADLYPKDPDGATPIAYLWARTVRCESPNCGAEIPLMRSMWLCRKPKRKWALRPKVVRR